MNDNENLYQKFLTIYNEDKMNSNKHSVFSLFLDSLEKNEKIKIHLKNSRFTGGLFIYHQNKKIIIKNLAKIEIYSCHLNEEFYEKYLDKLKSILMNTEPL